MEESTYPPHLWFALLAGLGRLEQMVWRFQTISEEVSQKGHAYWEGPEPQYYIGIIDGYLLHERDKLPGGNLAELERMRAYLQEHLVAAYQAGKASAAQKWLDASPEERAKMADFEVRFDFRGEAERSAPENFSTTEQGWFVEAFSRAWQEMAMEYHRELYERSKEERD